MCSARKIEKPLGSKAATGDGRCTTRKSAAGGSFLTAIRSGDLVHGLVKLVDKILACVELRGISPTPAA